MASQIHRRIVIPFCWPNIHHSRTYLQLSSMARILTLTLTLTLTPPMLGIVWLLMSLPNPANSVYFLDPVYYTITVYIPILQSWTLTVLFLIPMGSMEIAQVPHTRTLTLTLI